MLLLIDNYDSFTYNLYQYLSELGEEVQVFRNDKISLDGMEKLAPELIVISPGPGTPQQAGISNDVIRHFGPRLPVLGVCLGHQCPADTAAVGVFPYRHDLDLGQPLHGRGIRGRGLRVAGGREHAARAAARGNPKSQAGHG